MNQWEYTLVKVPIPSDGLPDEALVSTLNAWGASAWETIFFGIFPDRQGAGSMSAVSVMKRLLPPKLKVEGLSGISTGETFGIGGKIVPLYNLQGNTGIPSAEQFGVGSVTRKK